MSVRCWSLQSRRFFFCVVSFSRTKTAARVHNVAVCLRCACVIPQLFQGSVPSSCLACGPFLGSSHCRAAVAQVGIGVTWFVFGTKALPMSLAGVEKYHFSPPFFLRNAVFFFLTPHYL